MVYTTVTVHVQLQSLYYSHITELCAVGNDDSHSLHSIISECTFSVHSATYKHDNCNSHRDKLCVDPENSTKHESKKLVRVTRFCKDNHLLVLCTMDDCHMIDLLRALGWGSYNIVPVCSHMIEYYCKQPQICEGWKVSHIDSPVVCRSYSSELSTAIYVEPKLNVQLNENVEMWYWDIVAIPVPHFTRLYSTEFAGILCTLQVHQSLWMPASERVA